MQTDRNGCSAAGTARRSMIGGRGEHTCSIVGKEPLDVLYLHINACPCRLASASLLDRMHLLVEVRVRRPSAGETSKEKKKKEQEN